MKIVSQAILILCCWIVCGALSAQINITEEYGIPELIQRHKDINRSKPEVAGWCVQIIATTIRGKVEDARKQFLSDYPNIAARWTYNNPYYKLKVGAFLTKLEAEALVRKIKQEYPTAYSIQDKKIRKRDLLN